MYLTAILVTEGKMLYYIVTTFFKTNVFGR